MKRTSIMLTAVLGLSATAFASGARGADMGSFKDPAPVAACDDCAVYNWSGLYLGAGAGLGIGRNKNDIDLTESYEHKESIESVTLPFPAGGQEDEMLGGLIGVQVGYNVQFGHVVVGLEGEFNFTSIEGEEGSNPLGLPASQLKTQSELENYLYLAGKLGYADGRALYYVHGGPAWASINSSASYEVPTALLEGNDSSGTTSLGISKNDEDHFGWGYGVGFGYKLNQRVAFDLKYTHFDFDGESSKSAVDFGQELGGDFSITGTQRTDPSFDVIKASVTVTLF